MADIHVFFRKSKNREDVYKLLACAVESIFGIQMPKVVKDENGKPYFPERPDIHFSLSHSGEYVMCAVSDSPVGADIQKNQKISEKMQKRVFTENELECASALSLWCLKESFIKLKGKTDRPYNEMEFIRSDNTFCGPDGTFGMVIDEISSYTAAICANKLEEVKVLML